MAFTGTSCWNAQLTLSSYHLRIFLVIDCSVHVCPFCWAQSDIPKGLSLGHSVASLAEATQNAREKERLFHSEIWSLCCIWWRVSPELPWKLPLKIFGQDCWLTHGLYKAGLSTKWEDSGIWVAFQGKKEHLFSVKYPKTEGLLLKVWAPTHLI